MGTSSLVIVPVAGLGLALTLALNASKGFEIVPPEFLLIPLLVPIVFAGAYAGSSFGLARLRSRTITLVFIALIFVTAAKIVAMDLLHLA